MIELFSPQHRRKFTGRPASLLAVGAFCLSLLPSIVLAHDFWIEPEGFRPKKNSTVPLKIYVGQDFKGNSVPYIPETIEKYVAVDDRGEKAIKAITGDDPAGAAQIDTPGLTVIGYSSKKFSVAFDLLPEFERYLIKEGLERHVPMATKRHAIKKGAIHEDYYRCAKALIISEPADTAPADRKLGFPLELIAESRPDLRAGKPELRLQLLYHNKPLEQALVIAFNKKEPLKKLTARSDKDGRVSFSLPASGVWLVTSVHMIPASVFTRADWESYWASLIFETP